MRGGHCSSTLRNGLSRLWLRRLGNAMSEASEQEVYEAARKMVLRVLGMAPGERATVARLAREIEPSLLDENSSGTVFENSMFDVTEAFLDLANDEGDLLIDMSEHDGKCEGLPYNLDFIVRRRIEGKHLDADELLDKLEWASFMIGGYFQGRSEIIFRKYQSTWTRVFDRSELPFLGEQSMVYDKEVKALKKAIKDAGALAWENQYWTPVLDGVQWELQLRFEDGAYFKSFGGNFYPAGFNALVDGLIGLGLNIAACDYEEEQVDLL